ncbi:MAG: hypothetical protein ACLGI6_18815 [Gammaproteobacteria bacterium]
MPAELGKLAWLVYLAPSAALAIVLRMLARRHPVFFVFTLAGTLCHELAHYAAGLITFARPGRLSIVPRRSGAGWQLGSVSFTHLRWYNAAPVALAPLAVLAIPFLVAFWRTGGGSTWQFQPADIGVAFLLAPQFLSFWPSSTDWRLALRSWPYVPLLGILAWSIHLA